MRYVVVLIVAVLLLAPGRATAAEPAETFTFKRPWVFRSVLDQHARMLTITLSDQLWLSYDTQNCTLRKAWAGDVKFTGSVYDTRHGPQPVSQGQLYFAAKEDTWQLASGDDRQPVTPRYRGYTLGDKTVTLRYTIAKPDGGQIEIEERPAIAEAGNAGVVLVRNFTVRGLGNDQSLAIESPKSGTLQAADSTTKPTTIPANQTTENTSANLKEGANEIRTEWKAKAE